MFNRTSTTDARMVRQVLGGDSSAFAVLVERYLNVAYAVACAQLGHAQDAEDVVQDSFLKAFQRLNTLREAAKFGSWFIAIIRNGCRDLLAKKGRRARLAAEHAAKDAITIPKHDREELRRLLLAQVDRLTPAYREPLLLHYFAGKSVGEIATLLDLSKAAVKKRLQRARETLSAKLLAAVEPLPLAATEAERQRNRVMAAIAAAPAPWALETAGAAAVGASGGGLLMKLSVAAVLGAVAVAGWWALPDRAKPEAVNQELAQSPAAQTPERGPTARVGDTTTSTKPAHADGEPATGGTEGNGVVYGTVFDAETVEPMANVPVIARPVGGHRAVERGVSDNDGFYRIEVSRTDVIYEVMPEYPAFLAKRSEKWVPYANPDQLEVEKNLHVSKACSVEGRVYDAATGEGVPGTVVAVSSPPRSYIKEAPKATAGEDGRYRLEGLPRSAHLKVEPPPGMVLVSEQNTARLENLVADVTPTVDFALEGGIRFAGQVVDADGGPVAKARVTVATVQRRGGGARTSQTSTPETDENGLFSFHGERRANAEIYLRARLRPGSKEPEACESQLLSSVQGPFASDDESLTSLRFVLYPTAVITGQIVSDTGRPAPGATLVALRVPLEIPSQIETRPEVLDREGHFRITGMAEGSYKLSAVLDTTDVFEHQYVQTVAVKTGQHLSGIRLVCRDGTGLTLSGRVVDRQGRPIAKAYLKMMRSAKSVHADEHGEYFLSGLQPGTYKFGMRGADFAWREEEIVLTQDTTRDFVLDRPGTLKGTVFDALTGKPIPKFTVQDVPRDSEAGTYEILHLNPGDTEIKVGARQYRTETRWIHIASLDDGVTTADFHLTPGDEAVDSRLRIEGVVHAPDGKPVAGAIIGTLESEPDMSRYASFAHSKRHGGAPLGPLARTSAEGRFVIDVDVDGEEVGPVLTATHPDFNPGLASVPAMKAGVHSVTIALQPMAVLTGTVSCGGEPAARAHVSLKYEGVSASIGSETTEEEGVFHFDHLLSGDVRITIQLAEEKDGRIRHGRRDAKRAVLIEGRTTVVDFDFPPLSAKVEGHLTYQGGPIPQSMQGFVLALVDSVSSRERFQTRVQPDGTFQFDALPAGDASFLGGFEGQPLTCARKALAPGSTVRVDIDAGSGSASIAGNIAGLVRKPDGERARVYVYRGEVDFARGLDPEEVGVLVRNMSIAGDGTFSVSPLDPGVYTLCLFVRDKTTTREIRFTPSSPAVVTVADGETANVVLSMP